MYPSLPTIIVTDGTIVICRKKKREGIVVVEPEREVEADYGYE